MTKSTISIWGDSILKGIVLDEKKMRYKYLSTSAVEIFRAKHSVSINNYSRFGGTISRAYPKINEAIKNEGDEEWILIEFGGNDCDYDWQSVSAEPFGPHQPNTPYDQFEKMLHSIARNIIKNGKKPIFMTLPPIDADRYFDFICRNDQVSPDQIMNFLQEKKTIYRQQERYSNAILKIAHQVCAVLVDVREAFLEKRNLSDYLCIDGIHPNTNGQELIAEVFSRRYLSHIMQNS